MRCQTQNDILQRKLLKLPEISTVLLVYIWYIYKVYIYLYIQGIYIYIYKVYIYIYIYRYNSRKCLLQSKHCLLYIFFQCILLEISWSDIFVLCASDWKILPPGWLEHVLHRDRNLNEKQIDDLYELQEILKNFEKLRLDSKEALCLKAIALFNPCK